MSSDAVKIRVWLVAEINVHKYIAELITLKGAVGFTDIV